jgi:hypothetical protein
MYDSVQNAVYRPAAGAGLSEVTFVFNLKRNGASRPVFARPWSSVTGQLALFRQKVIASGGAVVDCCRRLRLGGKRRISRSACDALANSDATRFETAE